LFEYAGLVQFPKPSPLTLAIIGTIVVGSVVGFWVYEIYRRRERTKDRIRQEWRAVQDIINDRKLSPSESKFFKAFLTRHSPRHPLHAASTLEGFETCVEAEMNAAGKSGNESQIVDTGIKLRDLRLALHLDNVPVGQRITSTRQLHPNQWIFIAHLAESDKVWHRMMVQQVDEAYFYVSTDGKKAPPVFTDGEQVRCRLWRDEDGRYIFDSTIDRDTELAGRWRLHHAHNLRRTQSRAHFRIRHDQNTWVGIVNAPLDFKPADLKSRSPVGKLRGKITSLSAGGCAIVLPQAVARQVVLRITLELPGEKDMSIDCKNISSASISGDRYLVRALFLGLKDDERDRIAKYVLRRQQYKIAIEQEPEDRL
jgi:c-di-GMP-binding flagellar brake protein YcgR